MLRIVITGQKGFIGTILKPYLTNKGNVILDLKGDISTIQDYSVNVDYVIHLASKTAEKDFINDPAIAYETNINGTLNVLEFCRKNRSGLVFLSSCGVYGGNSGKVREDCEIDPQSSYAMSKYIGEQLCYRYWDDFHVPIVILRLFNVYGINQRQGFIVPYIHHCILNNNILNLKTPNSLRDFVYVEDACHAISKTVSIDNPGFNVFNVGSGKTISVLDLAKKIYRLWGVPFKFNANNSGNCEELSVHADTSLIKARLDWELEVSLDDGLKLLKRYYENLR